MLFRNALILSSLLALASFGCGGGGDLAPSAPAPVPAFTWSPTAPQAGQVVTFQDTTSGTPTGWAWTFGDGGTSTQQHPTHTFSAAGTFTVSLTVSAASGTQTASRTVTVQGAAVPSDLNVILGRPEATSIQANLWSPTLGGSVYLEYGTTPGVWDQQTGATALAAGTPMVLTLGSLKADTAYTYRVAFRPDGATSYARGPECRFHTARPAGGAFTFCIQADPHLDENSDLDVYRTALANVLADAPDFFIDLGDTFMCEKHVQPFDATVKQAPDWATVLARYRYERGNFGLVAHSAPLFLVNGNHEGEAGWQLNGTAQCLGIWATQARQQYYLNPLPDTFYSGDTTEEPIVGKRGATYAWTWGDALFLVLDPFWHTTDPGADGWNTTLGKAQYDWLASTLASSTATFKFVFIHNLSGGLDMDGLWRGGVEAVPFFEWGGRNLDGTDGFATRRPGWAMPIHDLLVKHKVTAVFHGHDHLYARQEKDGIVYQEVPQPSARNYLSGPILASQYGYSQGTVFGSPGHLRVKVDGAHVTVDYVRAFSPANVSDQRKNGQVDDTWSVAAPGWPTAVFSLSPATPLVSQAVTFTDASTGSPTQWAWDFGDGSTSAVQSPVHTFTAAGTYAVKLTVRNATGSHTATRSVLVSTGFAPSAAFSWLPSLPVVGQTVAFKDTSSQAPTAWSWDFGDGSARSNLQHPSHVFAAAGTFNVTLKATNAYGSTSRKQVVTVGVQGTGANFLGDVVLGCPTTTSITANAFTPSQSGTLALAYGTVSGSTYPLQTEAVSIQAGTPVEVPLSGLLPDTRYYYRLRYKAAGATTWTDGAEATFHTARPAGSTFTFTIQGDSHPERAGSQFDSLLYTRTLQTAAADQPDFHILMGDDFSVDTLDPTTVDEAQVAGRYSLQRPYLGLIGKSAPLFLVNGNHEQAARYLLDGTASNVAVWAQNARNRFYPQPAPDAFYSGNPEVVPFIGLLRNHFAWTWGDALFVVIDPYWGSPVCVDNPFGGGSKRSNLWEITHGDAQYAWLKGVLEGSKAKYKFVFAHHVMGTGRGGTELAGLYEWGGYGGNGQWGFGTYRPTWATPIHQLMAAHGVSIFFQGHDHIWVHQQLDGVTYQTLPEPADPTYTLWNADAFLTGEAFPDTGYARVTVSPSGVAVEYVRTWLPADEGAGKTSGTVATRYTLP